MSWRDAWRVVQQSAVKRLGVPLLTAYLVLLVAALAIVAASAVLAAVQ